MRKKTIVPLFIFLLFFASVGLAQNDSTILSFKTYLASILSHHPMAKQANLRTNLADAEWLAAKGNFDPVISSAWNQKSFDDKLYYRQFQGNIRIPTRLGIDVVGGYENTEGVFLNPENKTDDYGLWNLGIEVNLLQGLLTDERRTALKQAEIFKDIAENQKQILLNDLLYAASLAYLDWQKNYAMQQVVVENLDIALVYFENTKISFANGEKTAIDTLEALLIFQDAKSLSQYNESALAKSRQNLENYLWFNNSPLILPSNTQPENFETPIFQIEEKPSNSSILQHPLLLEKRNKQFYYEAAQRLKREKLKPKFKAKYQPLLATSSNSVVPSYSFSDYKWGFDFSFPLFLRKERGEIEKGKIKLQEVALDLENKQNELQNKVENSLQQQAILREQLLLQQQNVRGYQQLLEAENEKFRYGESSVFLLNKRQEKYINGQLKLIELNTKFQIELLNYLYTTNRLTTFK